MCACAAPTQTWYKRGATETEFNQARAQCRMQAAALPNSPSPVYLRPSAGTTIQQAGRDLSDAATQLQFMNDCLTSLGYHR